MRAWIALGLLCWGSFAQADGTRAAVPATSTLATSGTPTKDVVPGAIAAPNLFPRQSWLPPPPPPLSPPKPSAPPLPFKYEGQMEAEGGLRIFLSQQQKHLVVQEGDLIDGIYKVETVTPGQLVFVYLPLNERQPLNTGRTQ
ncbi:MAG: secretion system X translation initiation factor [Rhodocyclaceae bacterium]|nr:MAG: secretion system X translation initiation factor [Rhodocyclaceae bacterium]